MSSILEGLPVYQHISGTMSAEHYNSVQLALKRIAHTIRLEIPKLRTLDLILEKEAWIVVDRSINDFPIIAWTNFDVSNRNNLNQPIACDILMYHQHAPIIVEKVMEAMEILLGEKLDAQTVEDDNKVIPLKREP